MKELLATGLDAARTAGATYADVRIVERRENRVAVRDRSLSLMEETESLGYAARVLVNGAWGFASSTRLDRDEMAATARLALDVARASAAVPKGRPAEMAPEPAHRDRLEGPCEEDPFAVPDSEKADVLLSACASMLAVEHIAQAWASLQFIRQRRHIATTDGSSLDLTTWIANPALTAVAVVGAESQTRSYQGGARQAGYEFVRQVDLGGNAKRWAEEAVTKARADDSPQGTMDLVLDPDNLALTMHESVGHPTESDRVLGWEANMAGRSFVRPADVGSLRYGSDLVNFTVDNGLAGGVGSWFYDDDGVPMQKFAMIRGGVLVNLGLTRETAPILGLGRSNGCCRADGYATFPINRIPNLYMEAGPTARATPDDLIRGVERGVYVEGMGSFSIDQMRRNFQFGGDCFSLIENGRRTRPLKKVTYQAQTTDFWGSCDAIAGPAWWRPHGIMNCGKGEPGQVMCMTHGASFCRFRNVRVGGARI